jgi:hypothetical protein
MSNQKKQMKNKQCDSVPECIVSTKIEITERNMQTLKRGLEIDLYKAQQFFVNLFKLQEDKRILCFAEAVTSEGGNEDNILIYRSHILHDFNPFYITIEIKKRHCEYFNENGSCELEPNQLCEYCSYDCVNQFNVRCILKYLGREVQSFTCHSPSNELLDDSFFEFIWESIYLDINITYKFCKCGNQCFKNYDQCENCYTYNYVNEENCSICMENNYIWCSLSCGHKFHTFCIQKVENKKCPLCRAKFVMVKQI